MLSNDPYSRDKLEGYLSEIDRYDDELASFKGSYMEECKAPRDVILSV